MAHFLTASTRAALDSLIALDDGVAADPLERLRAIRSLRTALDIDPATIGAVRSALTTEKSWEEIADATGLKVPAAKWRWGGSDDEITDRLEAGRKRSARPSSIPTDLPGLSVAEAATARGVSTQAIYLQVRRGNLVSRTVTLPDGRSYKRVFPAGTPDS
ncbi:MAG: hypothetical protein LH475_10230 [Cryobacterium sp.]|uniref:hypothetical protein n=1 Tax=unclassified Cryobacterium TaxID=2649013 RepID=UPI0018C95884|nr:MULTISPECIES: hypothetical protein [unclassified Cryobacterium]MCY7404982.1 hypothetical protein [Cryobacterium sp.]MEC5154095.1 hypothetical protein [Cryobacterium sp. CAN_C3]